MANRKSATDRQDEILRATLRVVARKGFTAVTLRDVASEIGVSHGLVNHYFPERDELVAQAFDLAATEEHERWREEFSGDRDPIERLAEFCDPPEREHYLIWIDAWSEAPRNPALRTSLRRHHRAWEAVVLRALTDGVASDLLSCPDPEAAARSILAHFDGLAVQAFALGLIGRTEHLSLGAAHVSRHTGVDAAVLVRTASEARMPARRKPNTSGRTVSS
jgi:AcrR family transcriptional regulator